MTKHGLNVLSRQSAKQFKKNQEQRLKQVQSNLKAQQQLTKAQRQQRVKDFRGVQAGERRKFHEARLDARREFARFKEQRRLERQQGSIDKVARAQAGPNDGSLYLTALASVSQQRAWTTQRWQMAVDNVTKRAADAANTPMPSPPAGPAPQPAPAAALSAPAPPSATAAAVAASSSSNSYASLRSRSSSSASTATVMTGSFGAGGGASGSSSGRWSQVGNSGIFVLRGD
ncbi:MAG: hypothetical protein AAF533_19330 [Acidobacteriota bacterium]